MFCSSSRRRPACLRCQSLTSEMSHFLEFPLTLCLQEQQHNRRCSLFKTIHLCNRGCGCNVDYLPKTSHYCQGWNFVQQGEKFNSVNFRVGSNSDRNTIRDMTNQNRSCLCPRARSCSVFQRGKGLFIQILLLL